MNATIRKKLSQKPRLLAVTEALFVTFLWATSWVLIKVGLEEIPPLIFAGLRYILAFVSLLPVVLLAQRRMGPPTIPKRMWVRLVILGLLLYTATQGSIFVALALLPAITVNMLWGFSTVVIALLGIPWLGEHPTPLQWLGVGLAAFGVVIYFGPTVLASGQLFGIIVSIAGVLANAAASILGRDINRSANLNPLHVTVISMGAGSIALFVAGFTSEGIPSLGLWSWAIVAWLALVNTAFAFTLWNQTLRTLSATESSVINGTMLVWIPVLAVVFLGERLTCQEIVGLVVVGAGTLIVQLRHPPGLL